MFDFLNPSRRRKNEIKELAQATYSPYTLRMLNSNLPFRVTSDLPPTHGGQVVFNPLTGLAKHMSVQKETKNPYESLLIIEHESVHYDQSVYATPYNQALAYELKESCKISRVKELEAYGHQYYKLVIDFVNGSITEKDIENDLQHPYLLTTFIQSQKTGRSLDYASAVKGLHKLKKDVYAREREEALPDFYTTIAKHPGFMNLISDQLVQQQIQQIKIYSTAQHSRPTAHYLDNARSILKTDRLYQNTFNIEDAQKLLGRNGGSDHLSAMLSKERATLWNNIGTFSKEHTAALNWHKTQVQKLNL